MNCKKARSLISRALDGSMSAGASLRLKRHLDQCEDCRRASQQYAQIDEAFRSSAATVPPQEAGQDEYWSTYWDRLRAKLDSEPGQGIAQGVLRSWRRLATAAVVVIAVGAALFVALREHGTATLLREQLRDARSALEAHSLTAPNGQASLAVDRALAARDARLFEETDLALSSGLKWVATDGNKIDIGMSHTLSSETVPLAAVPVNVAAVQLSLFSTEAGQEQLLNRVRIVAHDAARAELLTSSVGLFQHYACMPMIESDSSAAVSVEISMREPRSSRALTLNTLLTLKNGEEVEAGTIVLGKVRYTIRVGLVILPLLSPAHEKVMS